MVRRRPVTRLALSLLTIGAALAASAAMVANAPPARAATTVQAVAAAMQPGWNLGNTFDSTGADETSWGNPRVTQELLAQVRAQGFKSIRIPVTWGQHTGAAPSYTIDPAYLARVRQVVDWALADGFYVMVNMHHDSWQWIANMATNHDPVLAQFTATYTQMAAAFRNEPATLLIEGPNEQDFTNASGDAQKYTLMNELNSTVQRVVRASGGNNATRILVLPTLWCNGDQTKLDALAATFTALNDPNVMATIHFYGYWPFSVNIAGGTTMDSNVVSDITGTFDRAYNTFISKGIPVIIGEYGLLKGGSAAIERGEQLKYNELFAYTARSRGAPTMLWDNGGGFNRTTYTWSNAELAEIMKTSWTTRSSTASLDMVFVPRSATVTDQNLTLNLNGNTLTSIANGSTTLASGTDYTLNGTQLTLQAALLSRLTAARTYGVNATLSLRFSAGMAWKVFVRVVDTPALSSVTGTTSNMAIPTQFNGDVVSTVESVYSDGTGAGPATWTAFQEYDYSFSPNYSAGNITLTSTYLNALADARPVTLTVDFWSGKKVAFSLVKNGSTVSGTASSTPPTSPPPTTPPPSGTCTAAYTTIGSWSGGFQGQVTVTAGNSAINGWTVTWPLASGQTISQVWNGTLTTSGSTTAVKNVAWNGALGALASTTFGFISSGNPSTPTLTCTSS
jgi:aryl-phospho-beta-D-glucosidase BglC (GH1 family)